MSLPGPSSHKQTNTYTYLHDQPESIFTLTSPTHEIPSQLRRIVCVCQILIVIAFCWCVVVFDSGNIHNFPIRSAFNAECNWWLVTEPNREITEI